MSLVLILPLSFRLLHPVVSWSTPFGCVEGISNLRCSTKKISFSPPKSAPPLNTPSHPQPSSSSNQEFGAIFNSVLSFILHTQSIHKQLLLTLRQIWKSHLSSLDSHALCPRPIQCSLSLGLCAIFPTGLFPLLLLPHPPPIHFLPSGQRIGF